MRKKNTDVGKKKPQKRKFPNFGIAKFNIDFNKGNCVLKKVLLKAAKLKLFSGLLILHSASNVLSYVKIYHSPSDFQLNNC